MPGPAPASPPLAALAPSRLPLRKAIRRLRWFIASFHAQAEAAGAETGMRFAVDDQALSAAFRDWSRDFEAQKPNAPEARRDYVGFAAGLMLRALLHHAPAQRLDPAPHDPAPHDPKGAADPARFWPEGFLYTSYCMTMRLAVLEQEFNEDAQVAPALAEIRHWWSFKENVREDPSLAIAFLDMFAGDEANWTAPGFFAPRPAGTRPLPAPKPPLPGAARNRAGTGGDAGS